jgi:hypothetical protein
MTTPTAIEICARTPQPIHDQRRAEQLQRCQPLAYPKVRQHDDKRAVQAAYQGGRPGSDHEQAFKQQRVPDGDSYDPARQQQQIVAGRVRLEERHAGYHQRGEVQDHRQNVFECVEGYGVDGFAALFEQHDGQGPQNGCKQR